MAIVRVVDGLAVEIVAFVPMTLTENDGADRQSTIADHYPASFLSACVEYDGPVEQGWLLSGETFVAPTGLALANIKAGLVADIEAARINATSAIGGSNEPAHIAKWELCVRHDNGDTSATQLLQAEATARGVTVDDFCTTVETARNTYYQSLMAIEAAAFTAKAAVSAASDEATARAAVAGFLAGIAT